MGYCMTQRDNDFRISSENARAAKKMFKEAYKNAPERRSWSDPTPQVPLSWISKQEVLSSNTFSELMRKLRWEVEMDDEENVVGIEFYGEKLGDDEQLFGMLAPFVEPGCFIEMQGEDGTLWRWVFDGKSCEEKSAIISWE